MWRTAARFLLGLAAGTALWWYVTPPYNAALGWAATRILDVDPRIHDMELVERGQWLLVRSASGAFPTANVPADQLTYNLVLFVALCATGIRPRIGTAALAIAILAATHVASIVTIVEALFANAPGSLGERYGPIETNVWLIASLFFRVAAPIGTAFVAWWMLRLPPRA